jgi:tRNA-Thr(GGU) m(6)t(6)A37 methyltransferase TsaA
LAAASIDVSYRPVGVVRSGFTERGGTPRQAVAADGTRGTIEVDPDLIHGLDDLAGFSHVLIVYHMHLIRHSNLIAHPPWDNLPHGVFATCSPHRPNPIGVSVVRLDRIVENVLHISSLDMLDGTPVLDIKPYVPDLFPRDEVRIGWLRGKVEGMTRSFTGER